MPKQVQFRRGTEEQNNNFTGASGEISINDTNNSLRVHDGSTIGGHELAKKNLSNVSGVGSFSANKVTTTSIQSQNSNISGISTLGTVIVSSGIISAVSGVVTYYGDGSNLFGVSASKWQTTSSGIHTLSNVGIGTTNPTSTLTVAGTGLFTGIVTASNLNISGTSTLGTVQISSGIVTATTGIITYYGDGSKLSNIVTGSSSSSQWVTTSAGIHTLSNVGIGTTNPIQSLQVGAAGTTVVVVDSLGEVGIGTTNPTAKLHVVGDINLDDGGTYTTTFQTITPTANRTISLPDATGTVALVAGSSAQLIYNNAGTYAGITSVTFDGNLNLATRFINTLNGAASAPPESLTGTWFSGGTGTTTKPQLLVEPSGTTSTAWNTAGTGLGINAASGFTGLLLDLQLNGTSNFRVDSTGRVSFPLGTAALPSIYPGTNTNTGLWSPTTNVLAFSSNGTEVLRIDGSQNVGISTNNPNQKLHVIGNILASGTVIAGVSSVTTLQVTGVSTFTNGPIFVGAATSTGTAAQRLQVTGGAYVSGNLGIGTTTPTSALHVVGNTLVSGIVTASSFVGSGSSLTGLPVEIGLACSDETTALTVGQAKVTFRMPYPMVLNSVRAGVSTAPTGSALIINVKEAGTTIFSTKPQIDAGTRTSIGSTVSSVLSDTALADDAEITIDIDQIGSTVAGSGLKVWIIGRRA